MRARLAVATGTGYGEWVRLIRSAPSSTRCTARTYKNPRLREIDFEALERASSLRLNSNPELPATSLSFVSRVTADFLKVAGNAGDPLLLDPCPFVDDGVCDAAPYDTLCADATDERDCNALH
jgi:hypothetical protein